MNECTLAHPDLLALVAELGQRFELVDGRASALSQTGEEYHEFAGDGIRAEGEPSTAATTPEGAIRLLREGILRYADGKKGKLYWRIKPEIDSQVVYEDAWYVYHRKPNLWRRHVSRTWAALRGKPDPTMQPKTLWYTYARLLISDKAVQ